MTFDVANMFENAAIYAVGTTLVADCLKRSAVQELAKNVLEAVSLGNYASYLKLPKTTRVY